MRSTPLAEHVASRHATNYVYCEMPATAQYGNPRGRTQTDILAINCDFPVTLHKFGISGTQYCTQCSTSVTGERTAVRNCTNRPVSVLERQPIKKTQMSLCQRSKRQTDQLESQMFGCELDVGDVGAAVQEGAALRPVRGAPFAHVHRVAHCRQTSCI